MIAAAADAAAAKTLLPRLKLHIYSRVDATCDGRAKGAL
jgi:hypothetical protein